mmetsp:Transcript_8803/g.20598  ORF Transcript_8803/g.20598 Transcript_8803/m.20598 type:complete len:205 (-) Transcript_8803:1775-2389(-)
MSVRFPLVAGGGIAAISCSSLAVRVSTCSRGLVSREPGCRPRVTPKTDETMSDASTIEDGGERIVRTRLQPTPTWHASPSSSTDARDGAALYATTAPVLFSGSSSPPQRYEIGTDAEAIRGGADTASIEGADEEAGGARSVTDGEGAPSKRTTQSVMNAAGSSKIERFTMAPVVEMTAGDTTEGGTVYSKKKEATRVKEAPDRR